MKLVSVPLREEEIQKLKGKGAYHKLTADIEKKVLVIGGSLHADAEELLLREGSNQDDIWGGGIDLEKRKIETTAVLNLRPRLDNDGLEILDPKRREKFISLVKMVFKKLWKQKRT